MGATLWTGARHHFNEWQESTVWPRRDRGWKRLEGLAMMIVASTVMLSTLGAGPANAAH